jgi:DNA-binding transcriptional LysR family regulator
MVPEDVLIGSLHGSPMIQKTEQGVQNLERQIRANLHWDDYRIVRAVAQSGSLRATARDMRLSVNTIRAHIERIESRLGQKLFRRNHSGSEMSEIAEQIVRTALAMETAAAEDFYSNDESPLRSKEIRVCCSEGIGEFWLTRRLPQLQARIPGYNLSLLNENDQDRVHSDRNHISLGFTRPKGLDRIVSRIASVHFLLYASDSYLEVYGSPGSFEEAHSHRFILHDAPGLRSDLASLFIGETSASQLNQITVNTSHSLYRAVADGVGIGALPTYVRAITRKVKPINLAFQLKFDLWLSYDGRMKDSTALRHTADWLRECFDSDEYPWFSEHFIHPENLESRLITANVVQLHDDS